jgi:hypothetical protein
MPNTEEIDERFQQTINNLFLRKIPIRKLLALGSNVAVPQPSCRKIFPQSHKIIIEKNKYATLKLNFVLKHLFTIH